MKRTGNLVEKIADIDNLRLAFWKARKGKEEKQDVMKFRHHLDKNLLELRQQILSGKVDVGHYHYFTIYDPKERVICAASFPERVLHHALMNICHPCFERFQVFDSYACRKGKGTYAALKRASVFQRKFAYFLKLDVRKYFDTISHAYLNDKLQRLFKDNLLLSIFNKIINNYNVSPGKGVPIGNLTSQYFANHALAYADHFVKEKLQVKGYVRYMDDMVLWGNNKNELLDKGQKLDEYIQNHLNQQLKPFCLNYSGKGLPFLGYLLYPDKTRLALRSKKRYMKKLKTYYYNVEYNIWDQATFQRHVLPLQAFTEHAQARGFRKTIESKIKGQWSWALTAFTL